MSKSLAEIICRALIMILRGIVKEFDLNIKEYKDPH